ncbi:MAG: hypothetical protein KTR28_03120 [Micavibrio sp.]|nr:hypothetical protein [Micavibrio sp.]
MKTNQEQIKGRPQEKGSALIYILIAIALFAALSFTLSRSNDGNEASTLSEEKSDIYATQVIATSAQIKSVIDQMLFTGTQVSELDFEYPPTETGVLMNKVHHSLGGGLIHPTLPPEAVSGTGSDPDPGWYIGRFNNVDWTPLVAEDVILVAYQIDEQICNLINEKIDASITDAPLMTDTIPNVMIDEAEHSGTNVELTTGTGNICVACENMASLCVEDSDGNFGFYTVIAEQ